jgi:hypothetical protein
VPDVAATIGTVEVGGRRLRRAAEWPIVAHVDPKPAGLGPAETWRKHRHGRVVAVDLLGREHVPPDPVDDRLQQPCCLANPATQRRTIEIDPLPRVDLALPIERQVIAVLRHQQMCEHRRCGTAARRRHGRCRRLGDRIACFAGVFGPDMSDDLEAPRHVVQYLSDVLTELRHAATAVRANARTITLGLMDDILPWQVVRQWFALRLPALAQRMWPIFRLRLGDILGLAGLQLFELQREPLDLPADTFR